MDTPDILSGDVAAIHKNEAGQTTHFETVGKNPDGTFNVSSWHRDSTGSWGAYHIGSYDSKGVLKAFEGFSSISINDERTSISRNPLLLDLESTKNETTVSAPKKRATSEKPSVSGESLEEQFPNAPVITFEPFEIAVPSDKKTSPPPDEKHPKVTSPRTRATLTKPGSETEFNKSSKLEVFSNASNNRIVLDKPSGEQNKDKAEHWSAKLADSDEFEAGVRALVENVEGDSPIEREINLYNVLPKDSSGALTPRSRKIWIGTWKYTHEKTRQLIVDQTESNILNAVGGFALERLLVSLAGALTAAVARNSMNESVVILRQIARLWHPIANRMRTLAILKTDKGIYVSVRGGSLTREQKKIFEYLQQYGFRFVDDVDGHAEFQVVTKALKDGANLQFLLTSKAACATPGHRCANAMVDFIEKFAGEIIDSDEGDGLIVAFYPRG